MRSAPKRRTDMDGPHIIVACGLAFCFLAAVLDQLRPRVKGFICPTCNCLVAKPRLGKKWLIVLLEVWVCPVGHGVYRALSPAAGFAGGAVMAVFWNFLAGGLMILAGNRVLALAGPIATIAVALRYLVRAEEFSATGGIVSELAPGWRAGGIGMLVMQGVLVLILAVKALSQR
jgi:hypothetical protein